MEEKVFAVLVSASREHGPIELTLTKVSWPGAHYREHDHTSTAVPVEGSGILFLISRVTSYESIALY